MEKEIYEAIIPAEQFDFARTEIAHRDKNRKNAEKQRSTEISLAAVYVPGGRTKAREFIPFSQHL